MHGSTARLLRDVALQARDATRLFRSTPMFDELVSAGRVIQRAMPDGDVLLCCESFGLKRSVDADKREVDVVASDGSVNRYGDVDDPLGWKTEHYEKNPVVLVDHFYVMEAIAGITTKWWVEGSGEAARFMERHRFDAPELNETARMVFNKVLAGSARTVSTSFIPLRAEKLKDEKGDWSGTYHFREMEKLETSWVAVPANRNATIATPDNAPAQAAAGLSEGAIRDLLVRTWAREHMARIDSHL
jgi:hypothetical protein